MKITTHLSACVLPLASVRCKPLRRLIPNFRSWLLSITSCKWETAKIFPFLVHPVFPLTHHTPYVAHPYLLHPLSAPPPYLFQSVLELSTFSVPLSHLESVLDVLVLHLKSQSSTLFLLPPGTSAPESGHHQQRFNQASASTLAPTPGGQSDYNEEVNYTQLDYNRTRALQVLIKEREQEKVMKE